MMIPIRRVLHVHSTVPIRRDDDLDLCVLHKNRDKLKTLIEQDGRFLFKDDHWFQTYNEAF